MIHSNITYQIGGGKTRSSNIELLRCVAMMMIIVHLYCVNSGLSVLLDFTNNTINTIIIQFMAFGGKVGVNIFFMISGYFMITGKMNVKKVVLFLLQIFTYNLVIRLSLWYFGGYTFPTKNWLGIIPIIFGVPASFIASYLFIYLLTPLINRGLTALSKRDFNYMLGVLLFYFTIEQTFMMQNTWHYLGWAFVMYSIGAYIRRFEIASLNMPWRLLAIASVLLVWGLIIFVDINHYRFHWSYFIFDANKLTMLLCAICIFMAFLTLEVRSSRVINTLASTCFGVLLIHANCDVMRQWLWQDTLDVPGQIDNPWLLVHMLGWCLTIFIICAFIELCRKHIIEKPLYNIVETIFKPLQSLARQII